MTTNRMIGRWTLTIALLAAVAIPVYAQTSATSRRAAVRGAQQQQVTQAEETQAEEAQAPSQRFGRSQAMFDIDRRPVLMLRMWNGSYTGGNPLGLGKRYRGDDAGERVAQELDQLYAQGWRRIMLGTPTGGPRGYMLDRTFGEWPTRTRDWQDNMTEHLSRWAQEHPDVTLGVYMGLKFRNHAYPVEREFDRYLGPWVRMGFKEFAFDASAGDEARGALMAVNAWLNARGARAITEAYGRVSGRELDFEHIGYTPGMALKRYVDYVDPNGKLAWDPETTEMWVGLGRGEDVLVEDVRDFHNRGFVILVYHTSMEHRARALDALGLLAEGAPTDDGPVGENFDDSGRPARVVTTRRPMR